MSLRTISECAHVFGNGSTVTQIVVPATPGKRVCVYRIIITAAAAEGITIQDTTGAALSQAFQMGATVPLVVETQENGDPLWSTAQGLGLELGLSGPVNTGYDIYYQLLP